MSSRQSGHRDVVLRTVRVLCAVHALHVVRAPILCVNFFFNFETGGWTRFCRGLSQAHPHRQCHSFFGSLAFWVAAFFSHRSCRTCDWKRPWLKETVTHLAVSHEGVIFVIEEFGFHRNWLTWRQLTHLSSTPDSYTDLGVKISHGHDYTLCATLGHFEVEFWCRTHRYHTWAQCWVQSFIVATARQGARGWLLDK